MDTQTTPNGTALAPGATIWTWCSACMDRTNHTYQPDKLKKLVCENDAQHSWDKRDE